MQELDATPLQYLFNLFFYLILCLLSLKSMDKERTALLNWLLIVVFCVFSFFAGDWFHYQLLMPTISNDFSEPIYYYFAIFVKRNYLLFRLAVWGMATCFLYNTSKRLRINQNIVSFVFIWFFLPTFCYARASLAMASYFLGLSLLLWKNKKQSSLFQNVFGVMLIALSYVFHRSFLPIIILTPFAFIKLNTRRTLVLLLLLPVFVNVIFSILGLASEGLLLDNDELESFSSSAQAYANQSRHNFNWKYTLISNLKHIGFYIPFLFVIIKTKLNRHKILLPKVFESLLTIDFIIIIIASTFFIMSRIWNTSDVLGYRFLYMTGIPTSILLSFLLQNGILNKRTTLVLLLSTWISTVGLIIGKLLSM